MSELQDFPLSVFKLFSYISTQEGQELQTELQQCQGTSQDYFPQPSTPAVATQLALPEGFPRTESIYNTDVLHSQTISAFSSSFLPIFL